MATPHSTLTNLDLHHNVGDSRSARAWTLAAGTSDALLIENSNGNDLFSITTSTTPGLTTIALGNDTDTPQIECHSVTFQIVCPDDQTVFSIVAGGETPVRVESSSTTSHTLRLNNAWMRMAEVSGTPTFVAGSGFLYTRDDAGTTRLTFMRDDGTTVDLDNAGGGGTPGGSDTQVQYNNAGAFGGMANVTHSSGDLSLAASTPSAPSSGLTLHARTEGQIPSLATRAPGQPDMIWGLPWASADVHMWRPGPGSIFTVFGPPVAVSGASTNAVSTPTSGTALSRSLRQVLTSVASTNRAMAAYNSGTLAWALETGFWVKFRVAYTAMNATGSAFVGLYAGLTNTANTTYSDSFVNCIGFNKNSGDSNWHVASNDGSGSIVQLTDLGSDFPVGSTTAIIDFVLYAEPGGSTVYYYANRVDSAVTAVSGSWTTDLPASSTFMGPRVYANPGPSDSTAVSFSVLGYIGYKGV